MLLLLLPLFYMPVTLIVILRISVKLALAMKEKYVNVHLFLAITISIFMVRTGNNLKDITKFQYLLFFLLDIFYLRLPATGIFTSWCASVQPNRYLNALYLVTFYVNYCTMLFPFLVSSMRLVLIQYPQKHSKINRNILKFGLPLMFLYPSLFTFFMIPALGFCSQPNAPYQFGAFFIAFQGSWFGLRNNFFLLGNTVFWMSASMINNIVLFVKLVTLKSSLSKQLQSQKSYRAEFSLTFTTFSMLFSYVSNGIIVVCAQFFPTYTHTAIMVRPFGNDLETCIVSWVFYLTYPIFRQKSVNIVMNNLKVNQ